VLIFSVTGYYGLFDLGIRSSIIRYVSKYTATGDREKLTQFVNTALFSRVWRRPLPNTLVTGDKCAHAPKWKNPWIGSA
jgi:hypothetical protein